MGQKTGRGPLASSPRGQITDAVEAIRSDTTNIGAAAAFRQQPVIMKDSARPSARFAEVAGGKTAECAVICCCFPCALISLVILAAVRLPAGLCRRALRKRILLHRSKKKAKLMGSSSEWNSVSSSGSGSDNGSGGSSSKFGSASDEEFAEFTGFRGTFVKVVGDSCPARSPSAEVIKLEKEVWSKFFSSGFWRSPSQKEDL